MTNLNSIPVAPPGKKMGKKQVVLVANGDLRPAANQDCWAAQNEMEHALADAVRACGYELLRAHPYKPDEKHGFIGSQKEGNAVFRGIDPEARLIVAEAVWQYSHHLLPGLSTHRGPILTAANWSGTWPGLVGMLGLNSSLLKMGVPCSSLWGEDFSAPAFRGKLRTWLDKGVIRHDVSHVTPLGKVRLPGPERALGAKLAAKLKKDKAIMGVFDEFCMGMYQGVIPDELLNPTGVFKERLSQSTLYYESTQVPRGEAQEVFDWYVKKGVKFDFGPDGRKKLTKEQVLQQCRMYVAAVRIADDFGCDLIGIQYQQGLKDLMPASDLAEGTLNNPDRPPVRSRDGKRVLYAGKALPHFNEADECSGLDNLMTHRVHEALRQPVANTLHDLRWGDWDASGSTKDFVWVMEISGSVPPDHLVGGWRGVVSERQPYMYFRLGGGTIKGISKPGEIVWSRIYVADGRLNMDLGRAGVIDLPLGETHRRWDATTPQWPIMHAVTYGVSRDQMMAKHASNHIQCVYAKGADAADRCLRVKAAMADAMGLRVNLCGTRKDGKKW